jgi:hypothetical protein
LLVAVVRRSVRPSRCRAEGTRRHRPEGDGPGHGDPPADCSPVRTASLRFGPVPRTHGQCRRLRARVRRTTWPHGQRGSSAVARLALSRAEPFFGATYANPMGLASRRRYRWTRGRISDYWDDVFTSDGFEGHAALDDQSAFIASLGSNRSTRMPDVLGTIQADQDAIIRAGSCGALVVDSGPGTSKVRTCARSAFPSTVYFRTELCHAVRRTGEGPHRTRVPRANTARMRWMAAGSASGSPSTARMSASKPGASRPL